MNFVTSLPISIDWKGDSYNSIVVIVDKLTKIVHYKPVKMTINAFGLVEVIINMIMYHHGLSDSIVPDSGFLFISKFWSLLCYFFDIKRWFSTAFYLQPDSQTKRQNNTIEVYLQAFVNFEQNN